MSDFKLWWIFLGVFFFAGTAKTATPAGDSLKVQKRVVLRDRWIAPDKGLHLLGSMMATVAFAKTQQQQFNVPFTAAKNRALVFSISLGLGKEFWDSTKKNNFFSWKDLTADCLGIVLGRALLEIK